MGGPYHIHRAFRGWGRWEEPHPGFFARDPEIDSESYEGGFALELTPVNELVHHRLRYNPTLAFRDGGPRGGKVLLQDGLTITFGEFVYAIFWEVGFMGSPELRDQGRAILRERAAQLEEELRREHGQEGPWR